MEEQEPKPVASQYERLHAIGRGSFGEVFLCVHKPTNKRYVLKKIPLARQSEWQRTSTRLEVKLVSMLNHPFIVPFIDTWTQHGHTVHIVYGYCEQGDLQTWAQGQRHKGKKIEEAQLKEWLCQLLLALYYLREKAVLHRDIKAGNIFLCGDGHVQIGDFGLATIRDADDADSKHDQSRVGTPHYMSPELLKQSVYSYATDIWSLGCVMYELASGRPPFTAFNMHGLVKKITTSHGPPPVAGYSREWNNLITKWLLHKDEAMRPTVTQLMASSYLRPALEAAMAKAVQIMPDVTLPPADAFSAPLPRWLSSQSSFADSDSEARGPLSPGDNDTQHSTMDALTPVQYSPAEMETSMLQSPINKFPDLGTPSSCSARGPSPGQGIDSGCKSSTSPAVNGLDSASPAGAQARGAAQHHRMRSWRKQHQQHQQQQQQRDQQQQCRTSQHTPSQSPTVAPSGKAGTQAAGVVATKTVPAASASRPSGSKHTTGTQTQAHTNPKVLASSVACTTSTKPRAEQAPSAARMHNSNYRRVKAREAVQAPVGFRDSGVLASQQPRNVPSPKQPSPKQPSPKQPSPAGSKPIPTAENSKEAGKDSSPQQADVRASRDVDGRKPVKAAGTKPPPALPPWRPGGPKVASAQPRAAVSHTSCRQLRQTLSTRSRTRELAAAASTKALAGMLQPVGSPQACDAVSEPLHMLQYSVEASMQPSPTGSSTAQVPVAGESGSQSIKARSLSTGAEVMTTFSSDFSDQRLVPGTSGDASGPSAAPSPLRVMSRQESGSDTLSLPGKTGMPLRYPSDVGSTSASDAGGSSYDQPHMTFDNSLYRDHRVTVDTDMSLLSSRDSSRQVSAAGVNTKGTDAQHVWQGPDTGDAHRATTSSAGAANAQQARDGAQQGEAGEQADGCAMATSSHSVSAPVEPSTLGSPTVMIATSAFSVVPDGGASPTTPVIGKRSKLLTATSPSSATGTPRQKGMFTGFQVKQQQTATPVLGKTVPSAATPAAVASRGIRLFQPAVAPGSNRQSPDADGASNQPSANGKGRDGSVCSAPSSPAGSEGAASDHLVSPVMFEEGLQDTALSVLSPSTPVALSMAATPSAAISGPLDNTERQRLLLLERIVSLSGQLYMQGAWQQLGTVLSSVQQMELASSVHPCNLEAPDTKDMVSGAQSCGTAYQVRLGDTVTMSHGQGIVRYIGPCHWDAGQYAGIELVQAAGSTDGTVDGIMYFRCQPGKGQFCRLSALESNI